MMTFWVALLGAGILAFPIFRILLAMKSRQTVSQYAPEGHQKKQGTPTMGGLIIVSGVAISLAVAHLIGGSSGAVAPGPPLDAAGWFVPLLILLLGFAGIGFVDDFLVPRLMPGTRGLGWKQKILMQVVLATVAAGFVLGWRAPGQWAFYVFLILFCSNAFNFLDGLDALAGSVLLALCGGLMAIGRFSVVGGAADELLFSIIGATIPFLFLNAPPAKIFMGDAGSLPIGALLGLVFAMFAWPKLGAWTFFTPYSTLYGDGAASPQFRLWFPLLVVGFVLVAELVPVPVQIFWVKVFKKRLFPYTPIHHAFEKAGVSETRVVWHFLLTQLVLVAIGYSLATGMASGSERAAASYHYVYTGDGSQP